MSDYKKLEEWVSARLVHLEADQEHSKAKGVLQVAESRLRNAEHNLIDGGGVGRNIQERFVRVRVPESAGMVTVHLKWSEKDSVPKVEARLIELEDAP